MNAARYGADALRESQARHRHAQRAHAGRHDVESDTAPGDVGDRFRRRETRPRDDADQILIGESGRHFLDQAELDRTGKNEIRIDAAAIVG